MFILTIQYTDDCLDITYGIFQSEKDALQFLAKDNAYDPKYDEYQIKEVSFTPGQIVISCT